MPEKSTIPMIGMVAGALILLSLINGCAPMNEEGVKPDYQQTKEMVVDILHTEEGKQAIRDVLADDNMKQEILLDEPIVRSTIQDTLLQADNKEKFQSLMMDPNFAKSYAEQLEEQHKKLFKDLMKDPDYRQSMIELLQEPDMEKQFVEVAKSSEFRKQTMDVMKESLQSPRFRLELLELLQQVSAEESQQQGQGGQGGQSGGGGEGGGGGDGAGGGGGGS